MADDNEKYLSIPALGRNPAPLNKWSREEIDAHLAFVDATIRIMEVHPARRGPALRGWLPVGDALRSVSLRSLRRMRARLVDARS